MPNALTNTYELVPIDELNEGQIVEYAQKQRMAEEF